MVPFCVIALWSQISISTRHTQSELFIWVAKQSSVLSFLTVFLRAILCISEKAYCLLFLAGVLQQRASLYIINLRKAFVGGRSRESWARLPSPTRTDD